MSAKTKPNARTHRHKTLRLPVPIMDELKRRSANESIASGKRVTETDLIVEALRRYLKIDL